MVFKDVSRTDFGEKMLWLCILRRSVFDYVLYKGARRFRRRWQECHNFIFGSNDEDDIDGLTFDQICSLFGWEPSYIRRLTKTLKRSDIRKMEATKFKEDFDEGPIYEVARSDRWSSGGSTPYFPPYNFGRASRGHVVLRVMRAQRQLSLAPVGVW